MKHKKILVYIISFIIIPTVVIAGTLFFGSKAFAYLSLVTAILACVPFFLSFEGEGNTRKTVLLAVAAGALSAVVSNFYFGQGPWTPFQMISWGMIGLIAGLLSRYLKKLPILIVYGALSGVLFSLIMDIWTTVSIDNGAFSLGRFLAVTATSLPVTAVYAVSNVIFLIILAPFFGKKIERLKLRYGI